MSRAYSSMTHLKGIVPRHDGEGKRKYDISVTNHLERGHYMFFIFVHSLKYPCNNFSVEYALDRSDDVHRMVG